MVQSLSQHLMSVLDAVLYGTPSGALAVVFSALNTIAPRVLLRYVRTCVLGVVCCMCVIVCRCVCACVCVTVCSDVDLSLR